MTFLIRILLVLLVAKSSFFAACSLSNSQAFTVNELNTFDKWIELYVNPQNIKSPVTNWSATVCTSAGCETQYFDFDIANGSFFIVLDGYTNQWHKTSLDILIKDGSGNPVNYFNLAYTKSGGTKITTQEQDAIDCGLDLACNYFTHDNNGQRDFSRNPDGGCVLEDSGQNQDTQDGSNDPTNFLNPIRVSIADVILSEGDTGMTQFIFNLRIDPVVIFGFTLWQPKHTSDISVAYSTADNTATVANNDYAAITNSVVTIPAGQTSTTVTVNVLGDLDLEADETFYLNLEAITVGSFSDNQGLGTIVNDDGSVVAPKDGNYNAIDKTASCNAQTHWNNNIQTKVLNNDINFSILAKDSATDLPLEANITKVTLVHYPSGNNNICTGTSLASEQLCTNCGLTNANGCLDITVSKSFNQRASQCVAVLIEGIDKDDTVGTSLSESNSSDNFAVRPDTFSCDGIATAPLIAEESYASTFKATPLNLSTPSVAYTTSAVVLSTDKYMRTGELNSSLSGTLTPASLSFINGSANGNLSFNDVGDIGIDLNDSTWANVDSDDTPEIDRVIHAECRRLFRPDHFEVVLTRPYLEDNASSGFTYLSNLNSDNNMSAWIRDLNISITAQGKNNASLQNYSDPKTKMYANIVTLFPLITLPVKHSTATKQIDLIDQNSSDITGFTFVNGIAKHSYKDIGFNYDRSFDTPIPPFRVDGSESFFKVLVKDRLYFDDVNGTATSDSDANATFYYGRLRPSDTITSSLPVNNLNLYEVYDNANSLFTQGMSKTSLFWHINNLHNTQAEGNISEATASTNTLIDNVLGGFTFSYGAITSGRQNLAITAASTFKATIHLQTQKWLWYVPSGFGSAYDDAAGSDCTMHPCFKFTKATNNTVLKIQSGDFNGTVIPDVTRKEYLKKGVKLFR